MPDPKPYGVVYRIVCLVNGKKYHGQTINQQERWPHHLRADSHCWALRNAVKKYGREKFVFGIVDYASSKGELDELEKTWVATSMYPVGYNLKEGGANGRPSEETRRKLSEANTRTQNIPEVKAKNSAGVKASWSIPGARERRAASMKIAANRPEYRQRRSLIMKEIHARPGEEERRRASLKAKWGSYTAEERASRIARLVVALSSPEYKERMRGIGKAIMSRPEVMAKFRVNQRAGFTREVRDQLSKGMRQRHASPGYSARVGRSISKAHGSPEGKLKLLRRRRAGESVGSWEKRIANMPCSGDDAMTNAKKLSEAYAKIQKLPVIDDKTQPDDGLRVNETLTAALYCLAAGFTEATDSRDEMRARLRARSMQLRLLADECDRIGLGSVDSPTSDDVFVRLEALCEKVRRAAAHRRRRTRETGVVREWS